MTKGDILEERIKGVAEEMVTKRKWIVRLAQDIVTHQGEGIGYELRTIESLTEELREKEIEHQTLCECRPIADRGEI